MLPETRMQHIKRFMQTSSVCSRDDERVESHPQTARISTIPQLSTTTAGPAQHRRQIHRLCLTTRHTQTDNDTHTKQTERDRQTNRHTQPVQRSTIGQIPASAERSVTSHCAGAVVSQCHRPSLRSTLAANQTAFYL